MNTCINSAYYIAEFICYTHTINNNFLYLQALWMLFQLQHVFLPQLSISLLGIGELVVPLQGMLPVEMIISHLVKCSELLQLQLYGGGKMPPPHLLNLLLVQLHEV